MRSLVVGHGVRYGKPKKVAHSGHSRTCQSDLKMKELELDLQTLIKRSTITVFKCTPKCMVILVRIVDEHTHPFHTTQTHTIMGFFIHHL